MAPDESQVNSGQGDNINQFTASPNSKWNISRPSGARGDLWPVLKTYDDRK